jgi:hypothetical protein
VEPQIVRRIEAKWLLLRDLVAWRRRPYDEPRTLIDQEHHVHIRGRSGAEYQIEIQPIWDTKPGGDIRVLGSIDDGRWRACCPPTYGVLIPQPDQVASGVQSDRFDSTL